MRTKRETNTHRYRRIRKWDFDQLFGPASRWIGKELQGIGWTAGFSWSLESGGWILPDPDTYEYPKPGRGYSTNEVVIRAQKILEARRQK